MPPTLETAHRFGKRRVILWGGVLVENQRAMRFYARGGFREVGRFTNSDGNACIDMLIELDNHQPLV
jgi:ribosomal protein S18 acetylase RimI-like enzyme